MIKTDMPLYVNLQLSKSNYFMKYAALFLLLLVFLQSESQTSSPTKYPQNYFANPLSIPISLSANFGELRPNHWHMGLDIRTDQKENLPVFASADGYVAHIGIRPQSFGRFIIIRHSNGFSTLYAHLNKFYPALEKFVREKQREKESWAIELDFSETDFKVKKGSEIGKSGNTGGSQGPHLHFEILDTKTGRSLNPQLFGLNITDNVPPAISKLAIYDRGISTYMQSPQMISVVRTASGYFTNPRKIVTGNKKISFAITATDKVNNARSPNGIFGAYLFFDNEPQIAFFIDSIDYTESDYVNAQIDKRYKDAGGSYVQHLSKLPGLRSRVYEEIRGSGVIELEDTLVHNIKIEVIDASENISTLFFQVQYKESLAKRQTSFAGRLLIPNQVNVVEEKEFEAYLPANCLYDSVPYSYDQQYTFSPGAVTALHQFCNPIYPFNSTFQVRMKAVKPVRSDLKNKVVMVREWKGNRSVRKAEWQQDWLSASFGDFGNFQAFVDTVPPNINAPAKGNDTLNLSALSRIVFTPTDNFTVKSFHAELDDQWLMFSNDKGRNYIYNFDEQCPYGIHELKVRVEDIVGNVTEKTWWFKKYQYTPPKKKAGKKKTTTKKKTTSKKK